MKQIILTLAVAVFLGACAEDSAPTDSTPPPNSNTVHDTVAVLTPPQAGGTLDGTWATNDLGWAYPCLLMQSGFRGIYRKLFWTDLRIDGARVWFMADEPNGGYRHRYNGTMSDSTITGWMGTWRWAPTSGESSFIGFSEVTFRKQP